jgi:hypothetical protein
MNVFSKRNKATKFSKHNQPLYLNEKKQKSGETDHMDLLNNQYNKY